MKDKLISIDCGKANTKVSAYDPATSNIRTDILSTNVSTVNALVALCRSSSHHIVSITGADKEINGTWMIGATGGRSTYSNSKKDMIHKIMTLTAIGLMTENGDTVIPAVGCPLSVFEDGEQKADLYDYLFLDGRVDITIDDVPKYYYIKKDEGLIFPESFGAMFLYPEKFAGHTGIIDIGGLNVNACYFDGTRLIPDLCTTEKLGCFSLISYLRSRLNAYCDASFDDTDTEIFLKKGEVPGSKGSNKVIEEALSHHVARIEGILKEWDTERMNFIFIGGTSKLLQKVLEEKYKDRMFIPEDSEFINCKGFLKALITGRQYNCPF